jgi:hypothetical protein
MREIVKVEKKTAPKTYFVSKMGGNGYTVYTEKKLVIGSTVLLVNGNVIGTVTPVAAKTVRV